MLFNPLRSSAVLNYRNRGIVTIDGNKYVVIWAKDIANLITLIILPIQTIVRLIVVTRLLFQVCIGRSRLYRDIWVSVRDRLLRKYAQHL